MDKIVLITGTSRGIGKFLAESLAKQGYVVVGCSRGAATLDIPNYCHFVCDVTDAQSVKNMMSEVRKRFGSIYGLINNAGQASMNHFLLTPVNTLSSILDVNLKSTFMLTQEGAKMMLPQKGGRIINFSTVAVPLALSGEAAYAASKAAIETLSKVTAKELAHRNITVNVIGPTPVKTDLIRNVPQNKIDALVAEQSIKRLGEFDDVLNVVKFYLNETSSFITGQVIYLGGVS